MSFNRSFHHALVGYWTLYFGLEVAKVIEDESSVCLC
jgi:hypothetical protein